MKSFALAVLTASLSGCCMFIPCHPGLWAHGMVTRAGTSEPIVGANVTVFGNTVRTGSDGCFKVDLADALPFEFTVTSAGYRPAISTPPRGYFKVNVDLARENSSEASTVTWKISSSQEFAASPNCK